MSQTLSLEGFDPAAFSLAVVGGEMHIGPPSNPSRVRGLKLLRVVCEVEAVGPVTLDGETLPAGVPLKATTARIELQSEDPGFIVEDASDPGFKPAVPLPPIPAPASVIAAKAPESYWLTVTEGADEGRSYPLPHSGTVTIGKSQKHADISLRDLLIGRVHCLIEVTDAGVTVRNLEAEGDTLVDGKPVAGTADLRRGSVLRIGNSHLALTRGSGPPGKSAPVAAKVADSGFFGTVRIPSGPSSATVRSADPLCQLEGQMFGNYRMGPLLGRGPTGAVYKAIELTGGRTVSLKVIPPGVGTNDGELEAFADALKAAVRVQHPNLVSVLAAGRSAGHCWIAREYVEGRSAASLAQWVKDGGTPSWTGAARIAVHLARGLECLREHRLLHGSITPHNVLVRKSDDTSKLSDVQLRTCLENCGFEPAAPKRQPAGLLGYFAPEQLEEGAFVDDLADLYSAGAVVYALLTGRPPYSGETAEEVLDAIKAGPPKKPSTFVRKIPARFDAMVLKLLAPSQADRYASPEQLLADFETLSEETGREF